MIIQHYIPTAEISECEIIKPPTNTDRIDDWDIPDDKLLLYCVRGDCMDCYQSIGCHSRHQSLPRVSFSTVAELLVAIALLSYLVSRFLLVFSVRSIRVDSSSSVHCCTSDLSKDGRSTWKSFASDVAIPCKAAVAAAAAAVGTDNGVTESGDDCCDGSWSEADTVADDVAISSNSSTRSTRIGDECTSKWSFPAKNVHICFSTAMKCLWLAADPQAIAFIMLHVSIMMRSNSTRQLSLRWCMWRQYQKCVVRARSWIIIKDAHNHGGGANYRALAHRLIDNPSKFFGL